MSLEELIQACTENGDAAAWEEFVRRFHGLIAAVVLRTARRWGSNSPELVDDLIQETYLKICADRKLLLSEFKPRHPEAFYGYLKVVTSNVVHDYFRARHSQKRGLGLAESSLDDVEFMRTALTAAASEDVHRNILLQEVDGILCSALTGDEQTQARDRTIFWLYYRYGLTAPAIARLPSISLGVKGVESVIYRLTRLVRERLTPLDETGD
ncbi:MAG: sigma-70 family RNA polymerase sigma factor [Terriglobales bacterium]|jgi:RNA polymerase sigma-70 factor (ECF subfamily)